MCPEAVHPLGQDGPFRSLTVIGMPIPHGLRVEPLVQRELVLRRQFGLSLDDDHLISIDRVSDRVERLV